MSACITAKMAGGTVTVAFHGKFSNVALKDPNSGIAAYSETHLALRSADVSLFRRGGRTGRNAHLFAKPRMPLRIVKHAALLASVQHQDELDIVEIKSLSDGSQLFTFGPSTDGPAGQAPSATAQVEQPPQPSRSRSSGYVKRSAVTKRPPKTRVPSSKPVEEPPPEPALPPRPRSSFAKRSPIPHSSERAPATSSAGIPVAVSPTLTPAREGKTSPSGSARLTGVRERSEAPVPTQERLRPKSRFVRASPIPVRAAGASARLAVPSGVGESSKNERPKAGVRAPSSYRKRSPIAKKSARKLDAEEAEPKSAEASGRSSRPRSSFKKPSLVSGRPARKTAGAASAAEAPEKEEGARPKRLASAYKKASPFSSAGRTARKPGARSSPDVAGAVANGVAQATEKVEKTVKDVFAAMSGASDSEGEGGYGSDDSDLQRMKLTELREIAKERKIKGMWTMKKRELVKALEVSFSEDV